MIAIAWGDILAGYILHVLDEFHGGYSCLQREGTNNMKQGTSVNAGVCICMREDTC